MSNEDIIVFIKMHMFKNGINIRDISRMTGLSDSTLYNWFEFRNSPRVRDLSMLCDALGLELTVRRKKDGKCSNL